MYSNFGKGIAIVLYFLLFYLLGLATVKADEVNAWDINALDTKPEVFTALPEQCVTLRQGRNCFATVELEWHSNAKQSFCLYQTGKKEQLKCWDDNNSVQIKIEFESNENVRYQLRAKGNDKVIAETQVEVSWQHKSTSRKRRWRLF